MFEASWGKEAKHHTGLTYYRGAAEKPRMSSENRLLGYEHKRLQLTATREIGSKWKTETTCGNIAIPCKGVAFMHA